MEINMFRKFLFALVVGFLMTVIVTGVGLAQEGTPVPIESITDNQVNAIAKQLYCPVCENIPLDVCPTQACAEWRELIRLRLAQGWSEEEIKADFAKQYGDRVLATPPAEGLNVMVYIIPPVAILAGAIILFQSLRSMRQGATQTNTPSLPVAQEIHQEAAAATPPDDYLRRMEEELRKR
jgi:cytochrome c-type biogenesis protein CcmH